MIFKKYQKTLKYYNFYLLLLPLFFPFLYSISGESIESKIESTERKNHTLYKKYKIFNIKYKIFKDEKAYHHH